jgi:adenosine deaminase
MNVRYCEIFFDPQGHTRTGVTWETMMGGFREASEEAERNLDVSLYSVKTIGRLKADIHEIGEKRMDSLPPA